MGLFDDEVKHGVDRLFDYNRDGKLDTFERIMRDNYIVTGKMDFDEGDDRDESMEMDSFDDILADETDTCDVDLSYEAE